jgi:hypothetical protein
MTGTLVILLRVSALIIGLAFVWVIGPLIFGEAHGASLPITCARLGKASRNASILTALHSSRKQQTDSPFGDYSVPGKIIKPTITGTYRLARGLLL